MATTRDINVGTPAANVPLIDSVGLSVISPPFDCAGHCEWKLKIHPGGKLSSPDGVIACTLMSKSPVNIVASYCVSLLKSDRTTIYKTQKSENRSFGLQECGKFKSNWKLKFVTREEIFKESNQILNNGTLSFLVSIKPDKEYYCQIGHPQPSIAHNIFTKLFNDQGSADVAFNVMGRVFYAHRLILKAQTPELFDLSEQFDVQNNMPISDVEPDTFEIMLKYVYGKNIMAHEWKEHSKPILIASGKYGLSALRVEAEAWYLKNLDVSVDNAIDELLYADANHCLLLKKAVINFIVENGQAVIASSSFSKLAESADLMKEVMLELAKSNENRKRKRKLPKLKTAIDTIL
eukprot:scaffold49710_cov33-Cyclotella_meneghiniana.AAC.1